MKKIVIIITGFLFSFIDFQTKAVEISYGTYFNIPAGLNMKFVDVNNDNDLDIISLVSFSQQVLIANNNHGIFSSYVFDVLFGSPDLALADFDKNTALDLVVAVPASDLLRVFFNNGSGFFNNPISLGTGDNPIKIVTGDFNNDANEDLIVANQNGNTISLIRGNGNGTFQAFTSIPAVSPNPIAAGNLDSDNDLDIVYYNFANDQLIALINNGMGVFAALPPISNFTDIKDIVIADVNGDGKNDIIVSRIANADAVSVFIHQNVNMPAFNPPQTFSVGDNPVDLALADLDNDNDLDIITANSGAVFGTLTIRANDGSGNFSAPPVTLSVGNSADFLAIGDLDGDNDLEIGTKDVGGNAIAFFNDTPAISEFTNKIVDVGQPIAPINFIISKPSDMFVFSAFSTNTAIIPNDAFSFEGTDTNRTLLIKPALANGVTLITVIVSNAITRFTASNHFNLIAINEPNKPLTGYTLDLRQPKTSKTKKFKSTKGFKFKARVITTNTVHNVFFATVIPGDTNNTNITFIAADKVKILDEKKKLFRKKGVRAVARSKSNKAGVKTPADTTSLNFIVKVTGTAGTNVGEVLFTNTLTTQVK